MPWIRTIEPEDATGRLAEVYGWQAAKLGRPTEFTQLGSLDAEVVNARLVLYRASEGVQSALTPLQKQLISYLTSILNTTPHCASLSRTQLDLIDGGAELMAALDRRDYDVLEPVDAAIARYVDKVTLRPGEMTEADIDVLRVCRSRRSRDPRRQQSVRPSQLHEPSRQRSRAAARSGRRGALARPRAALDVLV